MTAEDLENLFQSLRGSHVSPNAMYLSGHTIRLAILAAGLSVGLLKDDRGRELESETLYCVTERGTFRVA